jgi:hypothetical protein
MATRKRHAAHDTRPFYNVVPRDPLKIARAVADERIPIGCLGINIAFLRSWVRDRLADQGLTEGAQKWLAESGLEASPHVSLFELRGMLPAGESVEKIKLEGETDAKG